MFLSILKDSIIIFLLVYALLQLAEQLIGVLVRQFQSPEDFPFRYYVLDVSQVSCEKLEYIIRSEMTGRKKHTFLITEFPDSESNSIISKLCYEYDTLYPVTRNEFQRIISSPEALASFLGALQGANPAESK